MEEKELIIGVQCRPELFQTSGPPFQGETQQASLPVGTLDPLVGILLSPLNTNYGFYLSDMHLLALASRCCFMILHALSMIYMQGCHGQRKVWKMKSGNFGLS